MLWFRAARLDSCNNSSSSVRAIDLLVILLRSVNVNIKRRLLYYYHY